MIDHDSMMRILDIKPVGNLEERKSVSEKRITKLRWPEFP